MPKCGDCGKYMSVTDGARCTQCSGNFHRTCVGIPSTTKNVSPSWMCPACHTHAKTNSGKRSGDNTPYNSASNTPENLDLASELRNFRLEISAMRDEIRELRHEMAGFRSAVNACQERVGNVEDRVSTLEKRFEEREPAVNDTLESTITELKAQLNERDQDMLFNDVVISGIPETRDENVYHLLNIVSVKLGVNVEERDIVNVERVGATHRNRVESPGSGASPPRPRAIAVRLTRRAARDQLLRAARVRRNLNTTDLGFQGQSHKVYVNERLTRQNGKLFYTARETGKRHNYKYIWTKEGRIYMKKDDGAQTQRVRFEADLKRFFGNGAV